MKNSFRFFENRDCKYFPCHEGLTDFNCLFCYCPFYWWEKCPGNPEFRTKEDGHTVKNCTQCTYPHDSEHFDDMMRLLSEAARKGTHP